MLKFRIPKNTVTWLHRKGLSLHPNNFERKVTDKPVAFELDDVWYIPPTEVVKTHGALTETQYQIPKEIAIQPTPWEDSITRTIGFKLPENKLGIDYIVVKFSDVQWDVVSDAPPGVWKYCPTCGDHKNAYWAYCTCAVNTKNDDASDILRRNSQQSHNKYFPGYLPSN